MTDPTAKQSFPKEAHTTSGSRSVLGWRIFRSVVRFAYSFFALTFAALLIFALACLYVLSSRNVELPVWFVAEVEERVNRVLSASAPSFAFSVDKISVSLDDNFNPELRFEDILLLKNRRENATERFYFSEVHVGVSGRFLFSEHEARIRKLNIIGADLHLLRNENGQFEVVSSFFPETPEELEIDSRRIGVAAILSLLNDFLYTPALSQTSIVNVEAVGVSIDDLYKHRRWSLDDGRIRLEKREGVLAAEVGFSLADEKELSGRAPARVVLTLIQSKEDTGVRINAALDGLAAKDLAQEFPVLGWLSVLDAPISGRIYTTISPEGLTSLEADISLSSGAFRPDFTAPEISFEKAQIRLGYNPKFDVVELFDVNVESDSLRLLGQGQLYAIDPEGKRITTPLWGVGSPYGYQGHLQLRDIQIDPEGLFAKPLVFTHGEIDFGFGLTPFNLSFLEIHMIEERGRTLSFSGSAEITSGGWKAGFSLGLDAIFYDHLLQIWPKSLLPRSREWVGENVAQGLLTNVEARYEIFPGATPNLFLNYDFNDANIRFFPSLPPIHDGKGRASLHNTTYKVFLDSGSILSPSGGMIDAGGTEFHVADFTLKPPIGRVYIQTKSSIEAALSLIDLPPFHFVSKAGFPINLASGTADIEGWLNVPLGNRKKTNAPPSYDLVSFDIQGILRNVESPHLVPEKTVVAPRLQMKSQRSAGRTVLEISGPGEVSGVPFETIYRKEYAPDVPDEVLLRGKTIISSKTIAAFGVKLPQGVLEGSSEAFFELWLKKGEPGVITLESDLIGIDMRLPSIAWSKSSEIAATAKAKIVLAKPMTISQFNFEAPDLEVVGQAELSSKGGIGQASFSVFNVGDWLQTKVEFTPQNNPEGARDALSSFQKERIKLSGGWLDLRKMPDFDDYIPDKDSFLEASFGRLIVSDNISLGQFEGRFNRGTEIAMNGFYSGLVNGQAAINGSLHLGRLGDEEVRIFSNDAGAVLAASGVYPSASGGRLDAILVPMKVDGHYSMELFLENFRVQRAGILAELLSLISIVGFIEQLNAQGIAFAEAKADLLLTPSAIEVSKAWASGVSLGVSTEGVYDMSENYLDLQGVLSPFYILNGITSAFTKNGEGLFGFGYKLRGPASAPKANVNLLSGLVPGALRKIFRRSPKKLDLPPAGEK